MQAAVANDSLTHIAAHTHLADPASELQSAAHNTITVPQSHSPTAPTAPTVTAPAPATATAPHPYLWVVHVKGRHIANGKAVPAVNIWQGNRALEQQQQQQWQGGGRVGAAAKARDDTGSVAMQEGGVKEGGLWIGGVSGS